MDLDMWKHPSTKNNIAKLQAYGNILIPPANGELASGLVGDGRLAEPEDIFAFLIESLKDSRPLSGKKALVTAGPTYEAIDPVRFIGNHSSGKMGYALATKLANLGASVTLISGPTHLQVPSNITLIRVKSAQEMFNACEQHFHDADIVVMSAAVADYTPKEVATKKIKKDNQDFNIALQKTVDILGTLGNQKTPKQTLVGFALETNDELKNAQDKLARKNADFIVLNSMQDEGAGFGTDTNKVTIIQKTGEPLSFSLKPKDEVAKDICDIIIQHQQQLVL